MALRIPAHISFVLDPSAPYNNLLFSDANTSWPRNALCIFPAVYSGVFSFLCIPLCIPVYVLCSSVWHRAWVDAHECLSMITSRGIYSSWQRPHNQRQGSYYPDLLQTNLLVWQFFPMLVRGFILGFNLCSASLHETFYKNIMFRVFGYFVTGFICF